MQTDYLEPKIKSNYRVDVEIKHHFMKAGESLDARIILYGIINTSIPRKLKIRYRKNTVRLKLSYALELLGLKESDRQ